MKEILSDPAVIAAITSCIIALFGAITAIFNMVKSRISLDKANAYHEKALTDLETENLRLKNQLIEIYMANQPGKENE